MEKGKRKCHQGLTFLKGGQGSLAEIKALVRGLKEVRK